MPLAVEIEDIVVRGPTLDDVFLQLTGRHVEQDKGRQAVNASTDTFVLAKRSLLRIRRQPDLLVGFMFSR